MISLGFATRFPELPRDTLNMILEDDEREEDDDNDSSSGDYSAVIVSS